MMKNILTPKTSAFVIAFGILMIPCTALLAGKKVPLPDTTHDGLVRLEDTKTDVVYMLPDADLSVYDEVVYIEPYMAFHKDWQDWYNGSANMLDRISDKDMEKMLKRAKKLFLETFAETMDEYGYPSAKEFGPNVLVVRPAVMNIFVRVPDPDRMKGMGRGGVYTEDAGSMTFVLELYDSVSRQILLRAVDTEADIDDGWGIPRDYSTNKMAARRTFDLWAKRLAKGMNQIKRDKSADESGE